MKIHHEAPSAATYVATTESTQEHADRAADRSSTARPSSTMTRISGTISRRSRSAAARSSIASASVPPTWVSAEVVERGRAAGRPSLGPASEPGSAVRTASIWVTPLPEAVTRAELDAVGVLDGARTCRPSAVVTTWVGFDGAGGERLRQSLGRGDRLGLVEELVGLVEPDLDAEQAAGEDGQQHQRAGDDRRPAGVRPGRPTRWKTVSASTAAVSPCRGTIGQKTQRPKSTRSRRQHHQREGRGDHDADRAGQPEAAGRRRSARAAA